MKAIAAKSIISLRGECDENTTLIDEVLYGMPVEILEEITIKDQKWVKVKTHYNYEGFCKKKDLILGEETENLWVIKKAYADILSHPKVQGVCIESLPRGSRIEVVEMLVEEKGWVKVKLLDGRIGYTKESFLGNYYKEAFTKEESIFREKLIENAKEYLGTQYRWGGKTPLGIDCSGLTSMCYMLCGVLIYRDAQLLEGFPVKEISFEEKKPGDLIYFPGHIAMYIGDDKYIHSTGKSGSDGVVINSFHPKDEDYREDLLHMITMTGSIFK